MGHVPVKVQFINQAGLFIEEQGFSVCIDPWLIPSSINNPQLRAVAPSSWTMDFHLRQTRNVLSAYSPNCILTSVIHPHHSPLVEIYTLATQCQSLILATPQLQGGQEQEIHKIFSTFDQRVNLRICTPGMEFSIGPLTIRAVAHPQAHHMGWLVSSNRASVLHLSDARINSDTNLRALDEVWQPLKNLKPTFMFVSAGGRSTRLEIDQHRIIEECSIMSPTEAARLVAHINPRLAATFGTFNHSIRERTLDYTLPFALVEDQFEWALDYLAPHVKTIRLKPGQSFELQPESADNGGDIILHPS